MTNQNLFKPGDLIKFKKKIYCFYSEPFDEKYVSAIGLILKITNLNFIDPTCYIKWLGVNDEKIYKIYSSLLKEI